MAPWGSAAVLARALGLPQVEDRVPGASPSSPGLVWRQALDWLQARSLDTAQKLHLPVSVLLTEVSARDSTFRDRFTPVTDLVKILQENPEGGGVLLESRDSLSANGPRPRRGCMGD